MTIYHVDAVDPDDVNSSHALVLGMIEAGSQVLDVGCATGYLGAVLTERGCRVTGVEIDPDAARAAREVLAEVLEADLDRDDLGEVLGARRFDVVVLADVLEHLHDPARALRAAVGLLRPGGSVVVSIPNVTHGSLRLALLAGTWRYTDTGLLDRTHVRFFDRDGLRRAAALGRAGDRRAAIDRARPARHRHRARRRRPPRRDRRLGEAPA